MTSMNETSPADIVRIWFGRRGAWWKPDGASFTTRVEQSGLFRREKAERLTKDLGRELRIEFDLVVAARPPRSLIPTTDAIAIERPGLREILESSLRTLSAATSLPTGQAAMIEAQTADRLVEDLQSLRFPAFMIRPGHLDAGAVQ